MRKTSVCLILGVTGATIKLDANGDSEGNFSVLAVKQGDYRVHFAEHDFFCDYIMIPVGQFQERDPLPVRALQAFFYNLNLLEMLN